MGWPPSRYFVACYFSQGKERKLVSAMDEAVQRGQIKDFAPLTGLRDELERENASEPV
jgi:hypothetical protein